MNPKDDLSAATGATTKRPSRKRSRVVDSNTGTIWPTTAEVILNISAVTRWRRERSGALPPRDVKLGSRTGWKRSTFEAAIAVEND